ncbi:serine/threonine protein kinase [Falcatimonas sp. MSJ-15]|uniref:serine/threonine-protein kinase n=1 Tax=Falcatimonas sp. MSJ-15 TaxID=2841515 RepID=UPI001C10330B|nr:serine/threonine-protein kinase [Falcatimonas sp. MSJ-15]MBU5468985.1 serine/threonine protein kinase [Falcatimonas sp. MSJ-15]
MQQNGKIIDGKYEILTKIGQGGMSTVYLAMDKRLNKQWAIKEIRKEKHNSNNAIVVKSILAEAQLMKKLDHAALPRIVDIIEDNEAIYVVMDYIEGETLSKILREYGPQPEETVIEWAKQLCEVLDYLHTRQPAVIYRDMKPSNVMLKPDGKIKVIDFGIAREYKENNNSDTVSLGTRGYAAPEQFGGKGQTDARTDVYCLGVTLYHLVTGKSPCEEPYEIYPIRRWNPALSGGLEKIIIKCTRPDPNDRYQSCAQMLYDLNHYKEIDDEYTRRQKQKLAAFVTTTAISIMGLTTGIASSIYADSANNANYDVIVEHAQKENNADKKKEYLYQAIDIKPSDIKAYEELIEVYKSDYIYSLSEEQEFISVVNEHNSELKQNKDYLKLSFQIGKLYWYYYDYASSDGDNADNQTVRMKAATGWFREASGNNSDSKNISYIKNQKELNMAQIYADIGQFYTDIDKAVIEGCDYGMYAALFERLEQMVDMAEKDNETEIVCLEVYRLVMNSINARAGKFCTDKVPKERVIELCNNVSELTKTTDTSAQLTKEMKESIIEKIDDTIESVELAYMENEEKTEYVENQ